MVVLYGKYILGVSHPKSMELLMNALETSSVKFPTNINFRSKHRNPKYAEVSTWFPTSKAKKLSYLPFLIPVTSYIIYDACNKDIGVLVVYDRWMIMWKDTEK